LCIHGQRKVSIPNDLSVDLKIREVRRKWREASRSKWKRRKKKEKEYISLKK